ncbi:ROK family protein [Cohnella thailandensis]|uniref:ROK family protein n=1 Tax=Cohnella thailandensis TaxID=557557 RepID=A0A841T5A5_9BACL|nr:ROK family protein [Cohnella thailandensis]MBB6637270.1 ROK family protein [Cohnella thailandensis]MBP1976598.1 putative NBD/HSP70 family sugar kinase [Cohnella thailandensis]
MSPLPAPPAPSPKKRIFDQVLNKGIVSKGELMEALSLTSTSLTRLLEELISENVLQLSGHGDSTGGRRPLLYRLNPEYGYAVGLDISRIFSSIALFDMNMNKLASERWRMDGKMTPERLIDRVQAFLERVRQDLGIGRERIVGLGIGAVGPIHSGEGMIQKPLYFPSPGWTNVPIRRLLEERLGIPCTLENGANAALLGEHWALRDENVRHMLYVHVGYGLRSAVMSGGQIVYGATDMEGSIGQMIIQVDGPRLQERGNYGALEAFASIQALEKQARSQLKLGRQSTLNAIAGDPDQVTFDQLLKALAEEDSFVRELFTHSASYLGVGLANLVNVLHPEKVILGGALLSAHEEAFSIATQVAARHVYHSDEYQPEFGKGTLQEDAVSFGAALMVYRGLRV